MKRLERRKPKITRRKPNSRPINIEADLERYDDQEIKLKVRACEVGKFGARATVSVCMDGKDEFRDEVALWKVRDRWRFIRYSRYFCGSYGDVGQIDTALMSLERSILEASANEHPVAAYQKKGDQNGHN